MKENIIKMKERGLKPSMMGKKIALFSRNKIELNNIIIIISKLGLTFDIISNRKEALESQEKILVISK